MRLKFLHSLDRFSPPAVAAGWWHPSWPGLLLLGTVAAALGLLQLVIVLFLGVAVFLVSALCSGIWVCVRQQSGEGALLVAIAITLGGVAGTMGSLAIWDRPTATFTWDSVAGISVLFFLFGLSVAPCIITVSQRRFLARAEIRVPE